MDIALPTLQQYCQLKTGLYCCLVPTAFDETELMRRMWLECVLPECDVHHENAVKELQREGPIEDSHLPMASSTLSSSSTSLSSTSSIVNQHPRSIFTYEECWQHLSVVMDSLKSEFTRKGYEGFQFSAASTTIEQPNHVGNIHKLLKNHYEGHKYSRIYDWEVPPHLIGFYTTLKDAGLHGSRLGAYWKALCHLEIFLSEVCTIPMIREGFRMSNIYPRRDEAKLSW